MDILLCYANFNTILKQSLIVIFNKEVIIDCFVNKSIMTFIFLWRC